MTALARWPLPSALGPPATPSRAAIGPLTIRSGVHGWVVHWIALRLNSGLATARIAATMTGRCSGPAPASAALTAMACSVARPSRGASVAIASSAARRPRIFATRASVGGSTGRPSDHSCSIAQTWKASRSSGDSTSVGPALAVETGAAGEDDVRGLRDVVDHLRRPRGAGLAPPAHAGRARLLREQLGHAVQQHARVRLGVVEDTDGEAGEARLARREPSDLGSTAAGEGAPDVHGDGV